MTREEIIKALEVCDCNETGEKCHLCPMNHGFGAWENGETNCCRRLMQHARKLLIADSKKEDPGEWILVDYGLVDGYRCSKCGKDALVIREKSVLTDFCPFCGNPKRKYEGSGTICVKM